MSVRVINFSKRPGAGAGNEQVHRRDHMNLCEIRNVFSQVLIADARGKEQQSSVLAAENGLPLIDSVVNFLCSSNTIEFTKQRALKPCHECWWLLI